MQVMPGGLCYAHGPFTKEICPQWPSCATDPQQPEYVERGNAQVSIPGLERAVVEAAVKQREVDLQFYKNSKISSGPPYNALTVATDALLKAREVAGSPGL